MLRRRNPTRRSSRSPHPQLTVLTALAVPLLGLSLPMAADAAIEPPAGELDASFGEGGKVVYAPSGYGAQRVKSAVQPDDRIVVPGDTYNGSRTELRVTRFERDGAVDASFGTGGTVTTPVGSYAHGDAVAIQPDGRIVVVGNTPGTTGVGSDFLVARYTSNGTLDTTFGGDGIVVTDFLGRNDFAVDVALQADGAIVVAGETVDDETFNDYAVARYTPSGELDNSFGGGDGKAIQVLTGGSDWPQAMALQPDGAIVVTGTTEGDESQPTAFATARFTPNGSLDASFGGNGIVFTDIGIERGGAIALQSDGKLLVGGNTWTEASEDDELAVLRYHPSGGLDTGFGGDGIVLTDIGAGADMLGDILVQTVQNEIPTERIVAAGWAGGDSFGAHDFGLARYHSDGNLDPSFGTGGKVLTDFGGTEGAHDVLMQDDKILAVGDAAVGGTPSIALARYHSGPDDPPGGEPCVEQTISLAGGTVDARGCFTHPEPTVWEATGAVRVNGIDLASSGNVIFDAAAPSVTATGGITVTVGEFRLFVGQELEWDLSGQTSLALPAGFTLKGFPVEGSATLAWADGGATLDLEVGLPEFLGGIAAAATLAADMENGLRLDSLGITVADAQLGGRLGLKNLGISYSFAESSWTGAGTVVLPSGLEIGGQFTFGNDGSFQEGEASISNINHPIGSGVFLQQVSFGVEADPLTLTGGAQLTAGPMIENMAAAKLDGRMSYRFADPDVLRVDGALEVFEMPLADGFVEYRTTGDVDLGGQMSLEAAGVGVNGHLEGWIHGLEAFNIEGDVSVDFYFGSLSGRAVASTVGMAACATIDPPVFEPYSVGVGYRWGEQAKFLEGCDLGQYRDLPPLAVAGKARSFSGSSYQLAGGMPVAGFAIAGDTAPPVVTMVGPNGERVSSAHDGVSRDGHLVVNDQGTNTTYMALASPAEGAWTLEVDEGSSAVVSVRQADGLLKPRVTATVQPAPITPACLCAPDERVLTYDVTPLPGQTITFAEIGTDTSRLIGVANPASDSITFTPAPGSGERQIVAAVEQDGLPRMNIPVAKYER